MISLSIDAGKCNKCGMCIDECPGDLIKIFGEDAFPSWVRGAESACINCGHCVAVCPIGALQLSSIPVLNCIRVMQELQATPEQLEQFLKSRRSIRSYKEIPVEHEKLVKLIDIARYAPSGHNGQPVQWLIVENREKVRELAKMTIDWLRELIQKEPEIARTLQAKALVRRWDSGRDVITRGAPHLIVAHARKELGSLSDFPIAMTYLELAAHSMGLGACWAGYVQGAVVHFQAATHILQLPEDHMSFGAMMIGYPKYEFARIPVRNDARVIWR